MPLRLNNTLMKTNARNYLSQAATNAAPSGIRRMFELAKEYPDAINLTLGEPCFEAPRSVCEAAIKALLDGKTKYTPNAGIKELRDAIAYKPGIMGPVPPPLLIRLFNTIIV